MGKGVLIIDGIATPVVKSCSVRGCTVVIAGAIQPTCFPENPGNATDGKVIFSVETGAGAKRPFGIKLLYDEFGDVSGITLTASGDSDALKDFQRILAFGAQSISLVLDDYLRNPMNYIYSYGSESTSEQ